MRLNTIALSLAAGIFWAVAILIISLANMIWPGYGNAFLDLLASVYPGYHHNMEASSILIGTFYGLVDGIIGGAIFCWLYNSLSSKFQGNTV